jgi:hypothetical protein
MTQTQTAVMTFTEYRDKINEKGSYENSTQIALGMTIQAGRIIDELCKINLDVENGCTVRESQYARRSKIENEIGDFMYYSVAFHYSNIVEAEVVIHNEKEIDMDSAVDAAITLMLESATAVKFNRKEFLNITSLVADLCTALNLNLYSIMEKSVNKCN